MSQTSIEWTESTWNPVTGCSKISSGCANCYAECMAVRLKAMGQPNYKKGFKIAWHKKALELPLGWRKPRSIFVNSMSDLFHEDVPDAFIIQVFEIMRKAHWHRFQILTKRPERMLALAPRLYWPENVWLGVTVENQAYAKRVDLLRKSPAKIKFLSMEPLIGEVPHLNLDSIDWVIVGGESGPGARPMKETWVQEIKNQCDRAGVAFFFKQWGGVNKKKKGRLLFGRTWDAMPITIE